MSVFASLFSSIPIFMMVFLTIFKDEQTLDRLVAFIVLICLIAINVNINYFDYEISFDTDKQEWVIKRFNKEDRFSILYDFKILPCIQLISMGLGYYSFRILNRKFRFRYPYKSPGFSPFKTTDDYAKGIQNEIIQKITSSLNNNV